MCRSTIEVDSKAIFSNVSLLKKHAGKDKKLLAAVKANGYGHGAEFISRIAIEAGADFLGVATAKEGADLRNAGIEVPILFLGSILQEEVSIAIENDLILAIHDSFMPKIINDEAEKQNKKVFVHLKCDSGMGRLGVRIENICEVAQLISEQKNLILQGFFTHFAEADDEIVTKQQVDAFLSSYNILKKQGICVDILHATNSSATIKYKETHFDMVRLGIALYGYGDMDELKPVMRWRSKISCLKKCKTGSAIGYNQIFTTSRDSNIAVVPVGYADGYSRNMSGKAFVLVKGKKVPVVGMISMDYITVDVTDVEGVEVGEKITLIGTDGNETITAGDLASWYDTIPYCVTTGIGTRPVRKEV